MRSTAAGTGGGSGSVKALTAHLLLWNKQQSRNSGAPELPTALVMAVAQQPPTTVDSLVADAGRRFPGASVKTLHHLWREIERRRKRVASSSPQDAGPGADGGEGNGGGGSAASPM